ncbi:MAG: MoxR family ATPase [Lachnospiraceae bacterium]|nr:MoxR family ATPase [Lachnospiraceae bacterium]
MEKRVEQLLNNIGKIIVGKEETIKNIVAALLCNGHVLIEDVPGVGKTRLVSALAASLNGKFNRIQLTPDIMPSDIVGFSTPDRNTGELKYHEGVAVCNFLLADEINRASSKSQSALLEVMEEHQITIDGKTIVLPSPFMVLATQNHIETYGTYHLPEAQMDRFIMRVSMGYPTKSEEKQILEYQSKPISELSNVMNTEYIIELQKEVEDVKVTEKLKDYIVNIVEFTRNSPDITLGISPRGSIALYKASKAMAFMEDREYVLPDDIKKIAKNVLAHRIILSANGRANFKDETEVIDYVLNMVEVPVANEV